MSRAFSCRFHVTPLLQIFWIESNQYHPTYPAQSCHQLLSWAEIIKKVCGTAASDPLLTVWGCLQMAPPTFWLIFFCTLVCLCRRWRLRRVLDIFVSRLPFFYCWMPLIALRRVCPAHQQEAMQHDNNTPKLWKTKQQRPVNSFLSEPVIKGVVRKSSNW